jgi:hypothetical protein
MSALIYFLGSKRFILSTTSCLSPNKNILVDIHYQENGRDSRSN